MAELINDWPWNHWSQRDPQGVALRIARHSGEWQTLCWYQLAQRISQLASGLQQQGVSEGSGVALRGKNSLELLLTYLALLQLGARVLPLNPQLPQQVVGELLPQLNIAFACSTEHYAWGETIRQLTCCVSESCPGELLDAVPWQAERPATLTLTSGSSGLPKAALHSLLAHLNSAEGLLSRLSFTRQDNWLLSLPLFHVSGQGIVWRWLYRGACLQLGDGLPLATALAGCSHASLVATQLLRLLAQQPLPALNLRTVLLGGAAIPLALTEQAEQLGIECWCGYGMTEMASTVCVKRADGLPGVGTALAGSEVRLVQDEIWLRGGGMAVGYWRQGELLPLADTQGWLHTRDRGVIHDGQLHITGRLDNLFFSAGEGVQPEEVEKVLLTHPAIRQAMVVPLPDPEFGHRPVAVIEAEPALSEAQLTAWMRDKVTNYQRPIAYFPLDNSLKQGGIKLSRQRVLKWVLSQSDTEL